MSALAPISSHPVRQVSRATFAGDRRPGTVAARLGAVVLLALSPAPALAAEPTVGAAPAPASDDAGARQVPPPTDARESARRAFAAGQAAFEAHNFAAAEAFFARANELVPAVQAQYFRVVSQDQQGKLAVALEGYEALLRAPDRGLLKTRELNYARERRSALRQSPAELTLTVVPASATVTVSGQPVNGTRPVVARLLPGKHRIVVSAPGYQTQQMELKVGPGELLTPSLSLEALGTTGPTGSAASPDEGDSNSAASTSPGRVSNKLPAYVTFGLAAAGAAVGTVYGVRALDDQRRFDEAPSVNRADHAERNALIADMAFGASLTLGITAVVLLLSDDVATGAPATQGHAAPHLQLAPLLAPTTAGGVATWRF